VKSDRSEPLLSHLLRALEHGKKYGEHGLPLIGTCDWNDGMSLVGIRGKGESVWLAFFRILVLRKMTRLCTDVGEVGLISEMEREEKLLCDAIEKYAFDGKWYRRGYYDDCSVLGGGERKDCKIDLLPQAFAAIVNHRVRLPGGGKPFDEERVHMAMNYAYETLFDEAHGVFALLYPPFGSSERADNPNPGYIAGYPPGARENGGQYTHAAVWGAMGLFAVGEHERGMRVVEALLPTSHLRDAEGLYRYQKEPWALCGDVLTTPGRVGEGGWSLYTGSAGWYYRLLLSLFGENHEHSDT
jgi:cellobiose phosphorylase